MSDREPVALEDGELPQPGPAYRIDMRMVDGARWRSTMHAEKTVIVSCARERDGRRWLHLSLRVSDHRLPNWGELVTVKELFLGADSRALQVIPPRDEYVNIDPMVLHLWVCIDGDVVPDFRHGVAGVLGI